MKKIMKRLLTGVLTLATVFTTLPVTQVHAADSVYTTTDGKAGTIVKVDNGGSEVKSFEESIMTADGQIAYCVDINTDFKSGYKNRVDAKDRMSADQISDVALNLEYVKQYSKTHSLSSKQVYLLEQCVVWRRLSVHLGWGYNNVRAAYDEVSEKIQSEVYENAKAFAKASKDRYDCGGYIYVGDGQDLGQFWAKLAVGDGKIQKSSSNTAVTKDNDCYSLAGATYGVYSDKGCTKSVATLTTDGNGNTDTVELRAATYYVKETEAPKGFQLDKSTYTLTVKAGETATLKVSDTPKVTDTLVELFKIDMETGNATAQGKAAALTSKFLILSIFHDLLICNYYLIKSTLFLVYNTPFILLSLKKLLLTLISMTSGVIILVGYFPSYLEGAIDIPYVFGTQNFISKCLFYFIS